MSMMKIKNHITDMTIGNPMSHILIFAIPLFIGNFFQQMYHVFDIMIAGYNLGDKAVAAIGVTSSLYSLIIGMAIGMNNGFGIVVARVLGSKDNQKLKNTIAIMLVLEICIAILFTFNSLLFLKPVLLLLNTPTTIFKDAYLYAFIIFIGVLFTLLYNMQASLFIAVGNSRLPLLFLILSSLLNICLDWFFIAICHMGVAGAALATVLAQIVCVGLYFQQILRKYPELCIGLQDFTFEKELVLEIFFSGLSMGLMSMIFSIGSVILQAAINDLGTVIITAHTAARKIIDICMQPLVTLATANAIFVSQNYGARNSIRIVESIKKTCYAGIVWSVFAFVFVSIFARPIIQSLTGTNDELVIANAAMNLKINMPFYIFLGILLVLRTSLQGIGRKISPLISSSLELFTKIIGAFVFVPRFGYVGASVAEPMSWFICMLFMLLVYCHIRKDLKRQTLYPNCAI